MILVSKRSRVSVDERIVSVITMPGHNQSMPTRDEDMKVVGGAGGGGVT